MIGIQDVAKKAGVSIGTVSRVLNNNGYASANARERVREAVRELNYQPNEMARNLLQKRTMNIAIIVPNLQNPYFSELVSECERSLRQYNYKTMLCETNGEKSNEQLYLDMLDRNMVDGILTCTHDLRQDRYVKAQGPIVSFDTIYVPGQIERVTVDHYKGGALAANELLRSGCKRVLQFRDHKTKAEFPFNKRHEEFERIMRENHAECVNVLIRWNEFDDGYFEELCQDCFQKYPEIDGVFGTDSFVLHYMKYVQTQGKKIPDDIRFVSFDGASFLNMVYPTVTCIKQPIRSLADVGVRTLMQKIQSECVSEGEIKLDVELIRGISSMTKEEYQEYQRKRL